MDKYGCRVEWTRDGAVFTDRKYSRAHAWHFDGGAVVRGSSSPHSVRLPYSDPSAVDPEEALVAAVSSCHMLWFLSLAAEQGCVIDSYVDTAEARMGRFEDGREGITEVVLRPQVVVGAAERLDDATIESLHRAAHAHCQVGHSIRGAVRVEGGWRLAGGTAR
ncbi:MAG TPA: OsmC family protein [Ramlibacter sp.]|nr:OsmC family protein [Ramlibacter sp.]